MKKHEKISIEARNWYDKKLTIRLTGEGYGVEPMIDGLLIAVCDNIAHIFRRKSCTAWNHYIVLFGTRE